MGGHGAPHACFPWRRLPRVCVAMPHYKKQSCRLVTNWLDLSKRHRYAIGNIRCFGLHFLIDNCVLNLDLASQELHDAFNTLVSSFPSQRGLIATIKNEKLIPVETVSSSSSDFFDDLKALEPLIKDNEAAYIILRRYQNAPDGFVAVTYVPDTANVRSKMLFAATRLTLVRELGTERFRETLFATTKQELSAEGWQKHDRSGELKAPLTEEEQTLQGVRDAEAEASRGTTARSSHVSSGLSFPMSEDALSALKSLSNGNDNLVQLVGLSQVMRECFIDLIVG